MGGHIPTEVAWADQAGEARLLDDAHFGRLPYQGHQHGYLRLSVSSCGKPILKSPDHTAI